MLVAHLVPGYFAAIASRTRWDPGWNRGKRAALWFAALGSTVAPDVDIIYNVLFRGFFGHSILLTHSLFPYTGMVLVWWLIRRTGRRPYLRTMIGLIAFGGLSHLFLDVIAHGTTLLYPISTQLFGSSALRELEKGLCAYLRDPVFLLEPVLIAAVVAHWIVRCPAVSRRSKKVALLALVFGVTVFSAAFRLALP